MQVHNEKDVKVKMRFRTCVLSEFQGPCVIGKLYFVNLRSISFLSMGLGSCFEPDVLLNFKVAVAET